MFWGDEIPPDTSRAVTFRDRFLVNFSRESSARVLDASHPTLDPDTTVLKVGTAPVDEDTDDAPT